jgi:glycosyltransferase involved in cell wall biosynthesis
MLPFEGVLARRADLVIAQSAKLKSVLTQIYSVREASISVIPNSVDTSTFRFHPAVQRSKVVLFVGSLGWAYGPDILVNAAKHVLARVPDAEFTFVGAGPGKQSIIDLARSLGIEQHVHLVGLITGRKQLESYYASSRMLVMPQRIRGGYILSLAALESMAVGRPVLIGYEIDDTPGVISVKSDPVALAQQITDILMLDDESYSDLCRAARFSIEEFDTAAISERLEASYRSLIESRP